MGSCQAHLSLWDASHLTSQLELPEEQAKLGGANQAPGSPSAVSQQRGDAGTYCPLVPWGKLLHLILLSSPVLLMMSLLVHLLSLIKILFLDVFPSSQRS